MRKGFALPFIIVIIIVMVSLGTTAYFLNKHKNTPLQFPSQSTQTNQSPTATEPISNKKACETDEFKILLPELKNSEKTIVDCRRIDYKMGKSSAILVGKRHSSTPSYDEKKCKFLDTQSNVYYKNISCDYFKGHIRATYNFLGGGPACPALITHIYLDDGVYEIYLENCSYERKLEFQKLYRNFVEGIQII